VISLFYDVVVVEHSQLAATAAFLRIYLFLTMACIVVCAMGHAYIQERNTEHVLWVLLFYMSAPVYALWNFGLFANSITSIVTGTVGDWYVTLRAVNSEVSLESLATVKAKIGARTGSTADLHGMGHLSDLL